MQIVIPIFGGFFGKSIGYINDFSDIKVAPIVKTKS